MCLAGEILSVESRGGAACSAASGRLTYHIQTRGPSPRVRRGPKSPRALHQAQAPGDARRPLPRPLRSAPLHERRRLRRLRHRAAAGLRGNPGETLALTIHRPATRETLAFSMVREEMSQDTVRDALLLDPSLTGGTKIGYARLVQFNASSAREMADTLDRLEDGGMNAFILDLRNNPGGLLSSATEILGEFLPPDTVVVTTEGRPGRENPPPLRTPARQRRSRVYPVVAMVNHNSASAAELVAGALQDLGRAVIVGTTTFGKGSVQSIIPSDRGTALRLTTARYFTPSHKMIHGVGITPNLIATLSPEEEKRVFESFRDRALAKPDPSSLLKLGDRQMERAITALKGILSYKARPSAAKK